MGATIVALLCVGAYIVWDQVVPHVQGMYSGVVEVDEAMKVAFDEELPGAFKGVGVLRSEGRWLLLARFSPPSDLGHDAMDEVMDRLWSKVEPRISKGRFDTVVFVAVPDAGAHRVYRVYGDPLSEEQRARMQW